MNLVDPSAAAAVPPLSLNPAASGDGGRTHAVNTQSGKIDSEEYARSPLAAARGLNVHGGTAAAASQSRSGMQHRHNAQVEDWGPPPTFTEEDMRLHEASVAEQRAKKAAARAAKGRIPLNTSAAAVVTRADVNAHGRSSSAPGTVRNMRACMIQSARC